MRFCCSPPLSDLPAATQDDIDKLRGRGHLPCVATPLIDFQEKNHLQTVYVAMYENGTELTFLFSDEDRPNALEDCLYDYIRRPLFGRFADIETFFIIDDKVEFPGTYAGNQNWTQKIPSHNEATIELSQFTRDDETRDPTIWINTWNHLLGESNNNPEMEIIYQSSQPAEGAMESKENKDFVIRKGSRDEVDARFKGCITSVSEVMSPERAERLGKRLY